MITKHRSIQTARGAVVAELRGATKRFGAVEAVGDVNLTVRAGELLAVLGRMAPAKRPPSACLPACAARRAARLASLAAFHETSPPGGE